MVSTQRRSRSSRSEVASRLLIARMPVRGVRTSCAKAASAASTVLAALPRWRGEAFAALVEVRFLTCRFFGWRFLDGGALRFPRDPFAMISLSHEEENGMAERAESRWRCGGAPRKTTAGRRCGGWRQN